MHCFYFILHFGVVYIMNRLVPAVQAGDLAIMAYLEIAINVQARLAIQCNIESVRRGIVTTCVTYDISFAKMLFTKIYLRKLTCSKVRLRRRKSGLVCLSTRGN